ncbi:PREDICTED: uncharacterized protein LOC108360698 isoform X1 [Rhagoletis zephyria]|uniref:uncharacterized protein LOC108360698 isoform X1 n=1 Tax=Rhagoletis zephyria TaxID=28612 RepID=UPI0008119F2F|nr:PREDICTED: uncharacterized protein LOC108360698 isoform X1 [Rhagoletis zephyria]XP_017468582.1 PREDICTED: uncharacterized protein LOC108360698 isoform X1 [Rhagoletis zephyria]XP_017468583.1 PREDICTED: uncharacterized protein LOC108360698 isoform X1 [Rhagoletis zephyria]XP_017468584.1 PREDICTED: uncharacterized protein LOC108360698 isoform X1 [Rhagoletis zephyria]XP_017468585.1 PREDICTED: uncharacterized protein LOC108360698 isoform X1 [Rhagoletis zephyria]XP_017468586.1 PREDICTED: uncharact
MTSYATANDSNTTAATMENINATNDTATAVDANTNANAGAENVDGMRNFHTTVERSPYESPTTPSTYDCDVARKLGETTLLQQQQQEQQDQQLLDTPMSNCCTDYECDSFSDGHEKTDTTPENLKKIDDVIEQHQHLKNRPSSHYLSNSQAIASNAADFEREFFGAGDVGYGVGLAAAVDDSNAKFCFGKPLCKEKEMLSKSERIESHGRSSSIDCGSTVDLSKSKLSADGNGSDSGCVTPSTMSDINMGALIVSGGGAENSESLQHDDDSSASNATNTTTTATTNKQSYAFTIDNFNDSGCDPETAKARYKSMMERFQSRHRRGASMSKLEAGDAANKESTMTSSVSATPLSGHTRHSARNNGNTADNSHDNGALGGGGDASKVKLRVRDRSTSRVRDASKRHSWSPRSSTQEQQLHGGPGQHARNAQTPSAARAAHINANERANSAQKPLPPTRKNASKQKPPPLQLPKGAVNLVANRTQFTPRSTAMQLALQKVDFLCVQPPLAELKNYNLEADNISETGTYTLDGDNYTEEEKDLMNIDKSAKQALKAQQRPKNLQLSSSVCESNTKIPVHVNNNRTNVLEVNYYHDAEAEQVPQSPRAYTERDLILGSHESAGAYLEKIKSRVLRNASATKSAPPVADEVEEKTPTEDDGDLGCFTSVTTSGVLAKKSALDPRPRLTRKSGLSTSQIDSSEYVSNETKLKTNTASAYAGGGFTDHQKAEYRLNLFTNQKDNTQAKFAATRSYIESPPETPTHQKLSDAAVLKTAQTKNDWIQEWARNARARSLASETSKTRVHADASHTALMTRSYTCASDTAAADSLTDDSIYNSKQCVSAAKLNRSLAERYRLSGECDYSSDPTLSSGAYSSSGQKAEGICKPPKSPSKIPSPLHSIGRARSASRTRPPLQNVLLQGGVGDEEADIYLQKTAAAISNLQQSLSRKNSLKSPPTTHSSASPRAHSARSHAHSSALYSPPDDCGSPQHGLGSPTSAASGSAYHYSPLHRRVASNDPYGRNAQHLQLMTSSFNEQQLKLLTSGEYLSRQMRARKNSFDGNIGNSPARRAAAVAAANAQAQAQAQARQSGQESPLRRSSSFSAKLATTQRAARPQFSNIYTPPAARHNYSLVSGGDGQSATAVAVSNSSIMKKSASSNNFRQAIGDYDENFQYYINDEDDIGEEYYSSGAEEIEEEYDDAEHYYQHDDDMQAAAGNTSAVPLSNTRLNKALLMRIERSKQRVSGGGFSSGSGKPSSAPVSKLQQQQGGSCGVMACPNTPELPRRGIRNAPRSAGAATARQSVPRDTSLSRLASQVPNSLASAKKQLLQTAAAVPSAAKLTNQRVQPKYLDISKYKPVQGNNFLRKNESKSTLKTSTLAGDVMKRSPSSSSMGLSRADPTRTSNRSVRSVASCMTTSGTTLGGGGGGSGGSGRASSAVRRDQSVTKQKEAEMAMWKRRSTYDPMKAAAEDRRKKEEAKRLTLAKNMGEMPCESATRTPPPPFKQQQLSLDEQWTEYGEEESV